MNSLWTAFKGFVWVLLSLVGGFVLVLGLALLIAWFFFSGWGSTSMDSPSEVEVREYFLKHEGSFEALQDIYTTYTLGAIELDKVLKAKVDSLSSLVACKTDSGGVYYYFEGGTMLAGTDMFFAYIPDVIEQQAKFPRGYNVLPNDVDLHKVTHNKEKEYKHIKGHWYLGLSRY